ncbi:auxin-responsive protein SAUR68-like [Nymphaea colorata]|nr:auxin-responsive protein SAUR68-like [Nymphaea colorata]
MISTKRLVEMVRKWQKMAIRGRRRISLGGVAVRRRNVIGKAAEGGEKGHFAAYAADGKRFMIPLTYLHLPIFQQLLRMAEEEFGLDINGAITFPCDSALLECVMLLAQRGRLVEVQNILMVSFSHQSCSSSSSLQQIQASRQVLFNVC